MKLWLVKVVKLDACIRPLFANSVTYYALMLLVLKHDGYSTEVIKLVNNLGMMYTIHVFHWLKLVRPYACSRCINQNVL